MTPLISVIVPAYNLEGIISGTINALLKQDYPYFKIIIVDDHSSDNTKGEAQETLKGANIDYKIISHDTNRGVSAARNSGIDAVDTDLLMFFDGDDRCDENLLSLLYNASLDNAQKPADMTICGQRRYFVMDDKIVLEPIKNAADIRKMTGAQAARARLLNQFEPSICTLYRTDFIKDNSLRFHEGCSAGEDGEFALRALLSAKKIGVVDAVPYIYMEHPRMGSRDYNRERRINRYKDNADGMLRCCHYIKAHSMDKELLNTTEYMLLPDTMFRLISVAAMHDDRGQFDEILRNTPASVFLNSWHVIPQKSEFFLKSLLLLGFPNIYYRYYKKKRP